MSRRTHVFEGCHQLISPGFGRGDTDLRCSILSTLSLESLHVPRAGQCQVTTGLVAWGGWGCALQEFNTVEAAQALMESDARDSLSISGKPLTLDYSISQYGSRDAQAGSLADWICTMCQAVNFARHVVI